MSTTFWLGTGAASVGFSLHPQRDGKEEHQAPPPMSACANANPLLTGMSASQYARGGKSATAAGPPVYHGAFHGTARVE